MSIIYCKKTRRQFILGSGKTLLALPLLPSLLPRKAFAQSTPPPRRMMLFWYDHNNLNSMWPSPSMAANSIGNSGARETMLSSLGSVASHSPALNNARYEALKNANQLSIVRGFDIMHGAGHGNGGLAAAQDRDSQGNFPTIDTIIEAAQSVYPQGTPASVRRAIRINLLGTATYYQKIGGTIQSLPHYDENTLDRFYNEVFGSLTVGTAPPQDFSNQLKTNILNKVYSSFTSFRNGSRISADDRARVDQHMDYISDLQRSFSSIIQPQPLACTKPTNPGSNRDPLQYNGLYMDLLAMAFKCGLTKFSVMKFEAHDPQWIPGLGTGGLGVHDIMHGDGGASIQRTVKINWWRHFANLIADRFLVHMEEMEGDSGRSYLDNMVTGLICQGGFADPGGAGGHGGLDSQQILIGSMAGRLRAGRYMTVPRSQTGDKIYVGNNLPYNCFLITLLQLMGVPPAEYAFATGDGRGIGYYGGFPANYPTRSRFYEPVTELLT